MKFVIIVLALTLGLFAQEKKSEELKMEMKSFASAMEQIQHGILYNNIDEMKIGVKKLSVKDGKFLESHGEALMRHMPNNPEFVKNYAERADGKIQGYVKSLEKQVENEAKSYSKISATYTHILHECVGCHQKIRQR